MTYKHFYPGGQEESAEIKQGNKEAHGTTKRIGFEDFLNQTSPRVADFSGAIRIVRHGMFHCRQAGAFPICGSHGNPGAVGVGKEKSHGFHGLSQILNPC
jgi:hypothetical protein